MTHNCKIYRYTTQLHKHTQKNAEIYTNIQIHDTQLHKQTKTKSNIYTLHYCNLSLYNPMSEMVIRGEIEMPPIQNVSIYNRLPSPRLSRSVFWMAKDC